MGDLTPNSRHFEQLDRTIAHDPLATSEAALARAKQLVDARTRLRLAGALRGLAASPPVDDRHARSTLWRHGLLGLADHLERAGDPNPRGVARVAVLLAEYGVFPHDTAAELAEASSAPPPRAARPIHELIWWVADGLQTCPPHSWVCPVISKLEPDQVAWTCRRCGSIATTGDVAQRPE